MRDPLAEAQEAKDAAEKRLALITKLRERFPDLSAVTDRWKCERFTSAQVNAVADHVDIRRSCGCCPDAVLLARPYVEVEGTQVFGQPDCFRVARLEGHEFDSEWSGWADEMRKVGISETVIASVHGTLDYKKRLAQEDED